ncbi:MAG TPA: ATP-binding protein [Steroidobacteraceae bacterium]|nr:ATP-binding protein [Steroidobacteraceae bacterium]
MKEWLAAGERGLFIRSYVVLAGGLLVVAMLLDLGFGALQARQVRAADPWLVTTLRLMENDLAAVPAGTRAERAAELGRRLGLDLDVLEAGDISGAAPLGDVPSELVDDAGRTYYLWRAPTLGGAIRLGPFDAPSEGWLARLLPVLFYASILLIVGLWLKPLLTDLRVLTEASQKFASDYREPLDTARRTTQVRSLARNLDDMSARVSQLIQSQKEMTAALSHEMRTPLARVRFAVAVLEGEVDERLHLQLRAVSKDVQQIDDLISDMLDYARLDHPGLRMDCQTVPVEPWLKQVLSSCPPHTRSVHVRHDGVDTLWMEPRLMALALSNLLANALRYARRSVIVEVARGQGTCRLVVEDDGEGIPEMHRASVFHAFTRLDTSRNRDTGGFGLGLAIVARIAALHRGRVTAASSASLGGARFALEWPEG